MSAPHAKARSRGSTRKRLLAAVPIALSALSLAACATTVSTSGYKGEEKAVAQRVSEFQSDATASDEKKVCENDLAAAVKARLRTGASDCKSALKHQLSQIDTLELKIKSIAVKGNTASARVTSTWEGKSRESSVALLKEGSAWRISALQ